MHSIGVFLLFAVTFVGCSAETNEGPNYDPRVLENPDLIQGDIAGYVAKPRNAVANDYYLWPDKTIYYELAPNTYSAKYVRLIEDAMREIEKSTCLRFVPRENNPNNMNYLYIFSDSGCYSYVGKMGGMQKLSLANGYIQSCMYKGIVMHELLHAAGFDHEHNRSDRDEYLTINWDNITPENKHNFKMQQPYNNRLFTDFDYDSIMIYSERAFSRMSWFMKSMVPKQAGANLREPYKKKELSPKDIISVNKLYRC